MALDDRDYMRERKLRWDERRGSLRLDDEQTRGGPSGRRGPLHWLVIVVALAAVAGACAWWYRSAPTAEAPVPRGQDEPTPSGGESTAAETDTPVLVGTVTRVIDGDGAQVVLSSGPIKVRLHGIDAPERNQPWGPESTDALARRIDGREVALEPVGQDRYDRLVAVVYLGDDNVNAWMVQQGHAWAYRRYMTDPALCRLEEDARAARRGLWALPVAQWQAPWEWRAVKRGDRDEFTDYRNEKVANCVAAIGKREPPARRTDSVAPQALLSAPAAEPSAAARCVIKGNISGNGRIYHVPGSAWYERTEINESKGERWFCSEQEARDAGWRAPRG